MAIALYALWLVPLLLAASMPYPPVVRIFALLFVWRYLRLIIDVYAYFTLKLIPIPREPSYTPKDVTVITPTVKPTGREFEDTVKGALANGAATVILVTASKQMLEDARPFCLSQGSRVK